jgi:hypothetical protein
MFAEEVHRVKEAPLSELSKLMAEQQNLAKGLPPNSMAKTCGCRMHTV